MKCTRWLLHLVIVSGLISLSVKADEILDVEMGMEDAFQESEGARLEAEAAQRRQEQRQKEKAIADEQALNAMAKAKSKEREAKQEIAAIDQAIQKLNKEIKLAEEKRLKAEDQYELYTKKITDKRLELETIESLHNSKKAELSKTQEQVNGLVTEARRLDQQILTAKSKVKPSAQRAPASRPPRVLSLGLKKNCKAYATPSLNGRVLWAGQKGQKVSASSYDATWANLVLASDEKAFIAKGCF